MARHRFRRDRQGRFRVGLEGPEQQLLSMLPYLATIIVLTIISRDALTIRLNAPASLGRPYHPEA